MTSERSACIPGTAAKSRRPLKRACCRSEGGPDERAEPETVEDQPPARDEGVEPIEDREQPADEEADKRARKSAVERRPSPADPPGDLLHLLPAAARDGHTLDGEAVVRHEPGPDADSSLRGGNRTQMKSLKRSVMRWPPIIWPLRTFGSLLTLVGSSG